MVGYDSRFLVVVIVAVFGFAVVALSASPGTEAASGVDCQEAEPGAANTARLDASVEPAKVLGTTALNGTVGFVSFTNIPTDVNHTLRDPTGDEGDVLVPLDGRGTFANVSLCETGTWELVKNSTGEVVTTFDVTTDLSEVGDGTFAIDHKALHSGADHSYWAGSMETEMTEAGYYAWVWWEGDTTPPGYSINPETVDVWADWRAYAEDSNGYAHFQVCTESETDTSLLGTITKCRNQYIFGLGLCSESNPCDLSGSVTVRAQWKAGGAYSTSLYAEAVYYGNPFFVYDWAEATAEVLPQT